MSDSNIGARKHKNIRDHLFILYSVINSVINGNNECIDIQIFDIQKCFDSLWIDDCFNDLYDVLPFNQRNNKISLLYKGNKTNLVAVNTPAGLTERVNLPYIIQKRRIFPNNLFLPNKAARHLINISSKLVQENFKISSRIFKTTCR